MINKHKIVIMTKLSLYDKNEGPADRQANEFFCHDYIYRKNVWTRISVGFGSLILLAIYWLRVIFIDGTDIFAIDLQKPVTDSILFVLTVMAVYSLIGTIQGTRQYYLQQKRLDRYSSLLYQLERINERVRQQAESDMDESTSRRPRSAGKGADLYYGADIGRKRDRH